MATNFSLKATRPITTSTLLILGLFCSCPQPARAQSYLTQVGRPTFGSPVPVELGYYDTSTGDLHLQIPLGSWPQRGGYPLSAALVYDSRIWYVNNNTWQPMNVPNSTGGWRLQVTPAGGGRTSYSHFVANCPGGDPGQRYTYNQNFTWTDPFGTLHTFPIYTQQDPTVCNGGSSSSDQEYANDGTGFLMSVNNYTTVSAIYAVDGSQVYPSFEDTNGNYFSGDANGNVIDTLGRTPVKVTTNCNGNSNQICYDVLNSQFNGSTGTSRYTVTTESLTVHTAFGQSGITEYSGSVTLFQKIQIPDGTTYQFSYDSGGSGTYGELIGLTLPTLGAISYTYTTYSDMFHNRNRWLSTRTSGGGQWIYSPLLLTSCPTGYSFCQQVTVFRPSGDSVQYNFSSNSGSNGSWGTSELHYPPNSVLSISTTWTSTLNGAQKATITTQRLDAASPAPKSTVQYTYLGNLPLISKISEWNYYSGTQPTTPDRLTTVSYTYGCCYSNLFLRPTSITATNGAGTQTLTQTNITYDAYGSSGLISVTGVAGHDDTNFGSSFTRRGNATAVAKLVSGSTYLTSSMTYDTTGQIRSSTDNNGNVTSLTYADNFYSDGSASLPSAYTPSSPTNAYLTQVTLPVSGSISYGYYYGSGQKAVTKNQNGGTFYSHFYDSLGRPTETISPINGWALWQYPSGSETQVDKYTGVTDTSPSVSCVSCRHDQVILDGLARATSAIIKSDPDGSAGTTTVTSYDTTGRVSTISSPYHSTSDPTYGLDTTTFDALDRGTKTTHADGNKVSTFFGASTSSNGGRSAQLCSSSTYGLGYPALVLDEVGNKRQTWVDAFGRVIEVDEPDSSNNLTVNTCYSYDLNHNLTAAAPLGTANRTYTYDLIGRLTQATDPESGTVNYYYTTSAGSLCSGDASLSCRHIDARGITTTYSYDAENRLTGVSYSDTTPLVSYFYDQTTYNSLTITNGKGHRTGMADGSGQTAWSFDAVGNVLTKRQTIVGITNSIGYSHNADGSIATIAYPTGRIVTYSYNNAGRPTSAVDSANGINYATQGAYAAIGTPASIVHGNTGTFNGITESYTYNNRVQITGILASSSSGIAFNISNSYSQTAGNNGNLASATNNIDTGRSLTAGYDYLNRILSAQTQATSGADCWGLNFGDDSVANLLSETVSKCSAYSLSVSVNNKNQISNSGFVYDLSGNLTADGTYNYSYNAENQITSAAGVTYTYDGDGLRVKKTGGTLSWRGVNGQTLMETDLSGNLQNEYVYFLGRKIARRNSSGAVYYYFVDQNGSTRVITDSQGNKCYDTDYYPYGFEAGPFTNTCPQNYKFTGFEWDPETGLDYAFGRYYNPRLGRFMSPDKRLGSVGNPQSLNKYGYAFNNPLSLADGSGAYPQDRHLYVTYLLAMLAGWPDGTSWWLATNTAAQDDFTHATTGLLGLGAVINFSGHFGVPCNQSASPCTFAGALLSGDNAGAQAHLIEDNSPNGPHQIIAGNSIGARIGSELLHILLPIIGKNPDTNSSRLGGWLSLWLYLGGTKATYPGDLIADAVEVVNSQDLQIVGLQITINGQTTSHGDKPPICDDDECVIYDDTVNGVHLIIYQESGSETDYWNPAELVGTTVWWNYVTGGGGGAGLFGFGESADADYAYAAYLCSIGRCNDY